MRFNRPIFAILPFFFFLFFLATPSFGQAGSGSDYSPSMDKSPAVQETDKKALEKLKKMTPEEVEELDKQLAEALTLFYDREYARALPIFRGISQIVETMDIMFWSAMCAYKSGAADLAIGKFKQMLDVDPNLQRVRLELATAYFAAGKYDDSRRELETVLEARPPEAVRQNIERLIANIDEKTKRLFTNLRFSQGIQYDSNVGASPDDDNITVPVGGTLTVDDEESDWVAVTDLSGNVLYDLGELKGLMWNTTGSFYQSHNFDNHKFDFTHLRVTTGPWWTWNRSVLKVPFGYAHVIYEHEDLYDAFEFSPSYEYFFTDKFSLRVRFAYSDTSFDEGRKRGQEAVNRIWEITPNFYLNFRQDIISISISSENKNAKDARYSYDGVNLSISYFKRFLQDMEFYIRYRYSERDYKAPELLWLVDRNDDRHTVYAALSKNFREHCFASVYFNWLDNDTNTALYEYDKSIVGLSMGFKF